MKLNSILLRNTRKWGKEKHWNENKNDCNFYLRKKDGGGANRTQEGCVKELSIFMLNCSHMQLTLFTMGDKEIDSLPLLNLSLQANSSLRMSF